MQLSNYLRLIMQKKTGFLEPVYEKKFFNLKIKLS